MFWAQQQKFFKYLSFKVNIMLSFLSGGCWGILQKEATSSDFHGVGRDRRKIAGGESVRASPKACPNYGPRKSLCDLEDLAGENLSSALWNRVSVRLNIIMVSFPVK